MGPRRNGYSALVKREKGTISIARIMALIASGLTFRGPHRDLLEVLQPARNPLSTLIAPLGRAESQQRRRSCEKGINELPNSAITFLKSIYEKLAPEQHKLLSYHIEAMNQRDLHKAHYSILESSLSDLVEFVISLREQIVDLTATNRLGELQRHFLTNKSRFVDQTAQMNKAADDLHAQQYFVTNQQAWFMTCLQNCVSGLPQDHAESDTDWVRPMATSTPTAVLAHVQPSFQNGRAEVEHQRSIQSITEIDFASLARLGSLEPEYDSITPPRDDKNDASADESSMRQISEYVPGESHDGPECDSAWTRTMWNLIDQQLGETLDQNNSEDNG